MLHQVIAASSAGTAAGIGTPIAGFIVANVLRALWRNTHVRLPDGRRVTRAQRIAWRKEQYAINRAWAKEQKRAGKR